MSTGSGSGIDASKCCKRGGMCACGGGVCGAETRQYSGVREFIPPAEDLSAMMTKKCEQCGIIGFHFCDTDQAKTIDDSATYSTCIRELEKSLAESERELEEARRGLRMMTAERDALAAKVAQAMHPSELTSRVNAALGNVFGDDPVSACRAQDAIKPFLPSLVAPVVQAGLELVTLESALAAISHVGYYNGPGREQDAIDMLAAAPSAPQAVAATDRYAVLEEAAQACETFANNCLGQPRIVALKCVDGIRALKQAPQPCKSPIACNAQGCRNPNGRCEEVAPQPIAAPAAERVHIGNYANVSADALAGAVLSAASQQPVPALSGLIVAAERVIKDWDGEADDMADLQNAVRAAQLVQQRATLSDGDLLRIARASKLAIISSVDMDEDASFTFSGTGLAKYVRAVFTAAEAK